LSLKDKQTTTKNRTSLEIVRDILSIALVNVCKTRIMYRANLSFLQLEHYLRALLGNSLLSFDADSGYFTTSSGRDFLQLYEVYLQRANHLNNEIQKNRKERQRLEKICGFG
jgi:predicted transcriptional regulator